MVVAAFCVGVNSLCVFVTEVPACKGSDEEPQAKQQNDAFPVKMSLLVLFLVMLVSLVDGKSFGTVAFVRTAFGMFLVGAMFSV